MKARKLTYGVLAFRFTNLVVVLSLMFFIAQGNSMFITDFFADKQVELADCETPSPSEERNDTNKNNNPSEEDHFHHTLFTFTLFTDSDSDFTFKEFLLYPSVLKNVSTPPPEFS